MTLGVLSAPRPKQQCACAQLDVHKAGEGFRDVATGLAISRGLGETGMAEDWVRAC